SRDPASPGTRTDQSHNLNWTLNENRADQAGSRLGEQAEGLEKAVGLRAPGQISRCGDRELVHALSNQVHPHAQMDLLRPDQDLSPGLSAEAQREFAEQPPGAFPQGTLARTVETGFSISGEGDSREIGEKHIVEPLRATVRELRFVGLDIPIS